MSAPLFDAAHAATTADGTRSRTGLGRLCVALFVASLAVFAPQLGTTIVILPARLAVIAPADKVSLVAVFTAVSAIIGFIAIVTFGAMSDRTRSRLGRRNPWVITGALVIAIGALVLSAAGSVPMLLVGYLVQSIGVAALLGALTPVVPDRVPSHRRGIASTALAAGVLLGGTIGILIASAFAVDYTTAFIVLAVLAVVCGLAFPLLAPDYSSREDAPASERFSIRSTFAFPRHAPDFYWAFVGRLGVILGYYAVGGYQLYILTDYMHLTAAGAAAVLGTAALVNVAGAIVGSVVGGPLSDRLQRRKIVTITSSVIMGIAALVPLLGPHPWAFLVYTGIAGLGLGMFFSVDAALMSQLLPSQASRGKDLGILALATNGGQVLGPIVGSVVVVTAGFSPIFVVGFLLCIVGGALLLPIRNVR